MADDATPKRPEPASDAKKHANKRVVLSSVAKVAPISEAESLLGEPEPSKGGPPELPPKTADGGLIRPVGWTTRPGGTTTIIKLPPKTGTLPRMMSLSPKVGQEAPPLPPERDALNGEESAKRPSPIKIDPPVSPAPTEQESIFAPAPSEPIRATAPPVSAEAKTPTAPVGAKAPTAPTEIKAPHSPMEAKLAPPTAIPAKIPPAQVAARPPIPPVEARTSPPITPKRAVPPPLPPRPLPAPAVKPPGPVVASSRTQPVTPDKVEPHRVTHAPPLVAHDASAPETETGAPPKYDPLAQTVKLSPPPSIHRPTTEPGRQGLLPLPEAPKRAIPTVAPIAEAKSAESALTKHRLPPRSSATGRLRPAPEPAPPSSLGQKSAAIPPKVFPATPVAPIISSAAAKPAPPLASKPQPVKSSVTPPTIPLHPGRVKPPTIPLRPAPSAFAPLSALPRADEDDEVDEEEAPEATPSSRAVRKRRRRRVGIAVFYVLLVVMVPCLYEGALYFTRETRVEGQIIPPPGMLLGNEVWIVTDFRELEKGIADDLADDRQIVVQDMQEKLGHVQRAQSDVATREGRIRLLKDQIQADNDEEMSLMKQARDASQQIWDGPGAQLEVDYQSRLTTLNQAIADRAKANHLQYNPDPNYYSPEVWANAYRLALYEVPAGVDSVKERTWLDAQMKAWHDFTKAMDQQQSDLRQQATQLKLQPASKVADIKAQVEDLQQRIDATIAEEEPLKAELEQARNDLAAAQAKEAGLDAKPYEKLDALPEQNVTKRLPLEANGRFSWREVEKENKYAADERAHVFWMFARAFRADGRQYWALNRFTVDKDSTTLLMVEPNSFVSTKAILRPDLSPDEQAQ